MLGGGECRLAQIPSNRSNGFCIFSQIVPEKIFILLILNIFIVYSRIANEPKLSQ
jgi:hypothetical protein